MPKKTRSIEREPSHVLIHTYAGQTIQPLEGRVLVEAAGAAVEKRVGDLQPGDKVLERGRKAKVSVREIMAELLKKDAEYQAAHAQLYHYPEGSAEPRTRFSSFLHQLLRERGVEPELGVRGKKIEAARTIMEILGAQQRKYAGRLKAITGRELPKITRTRRAVEEWLTGKTRLPNDPTVMRLLSGVNPTKFKELFGSARNFVQREGRPLEEYPPLWAAKHLHDAHDAVRVSLAGMSEKAITAEGGEVEIPSEQEAKRRDEKSTTSTDRRAYLARIRWLIFNRYLRPIQTEVDREHRFIAIKSLKRIVAGGKKGEGIPKGPVLSKGVVASGKVDADVAAQLEIRDMKSLYRERMALTHILERAFGRMQIPLPKTTPIGLFVRELLEEEIAEGVNGKKYRFPDSSAPGGIRTVTLNREQIQEIQKTAYAHLQNGELDGANGLERGTLIRIVQRERELRKAIPVISDIMKFNEALIEARRRQPQLFREKIQPRDQQVLQSVREQLARLATRPLYYGIDPRGLLHPENLGVVSMGEIQSHLKRRDSRPLLKPLIGREMHLEMPLTEAEVTSAVSKITDKSAEQQRLLTLFGRRNFITK